MYINTEACSILECVLSLTWFFIVINLWGSLKLVASPMKFMGKILIHTNLMVVYVSHPVSMCCTFALIM